MSKFYFNNVQKSQSERKGKCGAKLLSGSLSASFMIWLLKICIGLSVLLSSFVQTVFDKPPSLRTAAAPPYAPSSSSSESSSSHRQENRGTHSQCFFFFFAFLKSSVYHVSKLTYHVKNVHRSVVPTQIRQQKTVLFIQPYVRQAALTSVLSLSHHV